MAAILKAEAEYLRNSSAHFIFVRSRSDNSQMKRNTYLVDQESKKYDIPKDNKSTILFSWK